jgi:hypothetical protein
MHRCRIILDAHLRLHWLIEDYIAAFTNNRRPPEQEFMRASSADA